MNPSQISSNNGPSQGESAFRYQEIVRLPRSLSAALFDVDKTIVTNSEGLYQYLLAQSVHHHASSNFSRYEIGQLAERTFDNTYPLRETIRALASWCRDNGGSCSDEAFSNTFWAMVDHFAAREDKSEFRLVSMPGALPLISQLLTVTNGNLAVYSAAPRKLASLALRVVGVESHFKAKIFNEDLPEGTSKAQPLGWENALRTLGVRNGPIVGFEDRPEGALGLLRAGAEFVVVAPSVTPSVFHSRLNDYLKDEPAAQQANLLGRLSFVKSWESVEFE